ncbi:MAG: GNAT family N-acetyltransferase [Hyphomicrobium sp.]
MSDDTPHDIDSAAASIRKVLKAEERLLREHLLRLDAESRRLRFGHTVADGFIESYAAGALGAGSVIYADFVDGEIRAAAELRRIGPTWSDTAEVAFSVERPLHNHGIATALMGRVIRSARNRGVHHLKLTCLAENGKMRAIAEKYNADLHFDHGEVVGDIVTPRPDYFSITTEVFEDRLGYFLAILDLQSRQRKSAA